MSLHVRVLGRGLLKSAGAAQTIGEAWLYQAPNIASPSTEKRAAFITAILFGSLEVSASSITINIYLVRKGKDPSDLANNGILILPPELRFYGAQGVVDAFGLAMEEGDLLVGNASVPNTVVYSISGIERDVV